MRFDVITLFPELFSAHLVHGVTRRAFAPERIDVHLWPLRDFGDPPHARVDDRPYGGGPGMVLLAEPLARALAAVRAGTRRGRAGAVAQLLAGRNAAAPGRGRRFAAGAGAILLCARYEGIDQRFIDAHVDIELSVGDYVLSGGELPALAAARRRSRGCSQACSATHARTSRTASRPGCSTSRTTAGPSAWRPTAPAVPEVLLGGNHGAIDAWRREQLARPDRRAPPRPDRRRARRKASSTPGDEAILARHAAAKL